jgi:glycosyltransferase involved in cell wall biosynthesis
MRLTMNFSEESAVGDYRVKIPVKYINRIPGIETKVTGGMKPVKYDGYNEDLDGSLKQAVEWADICVFQRVDSLMNMALLGTIIEKYNKPVVMDLDDNFVSIDRRHPCYEIYRDKTASEIFDFLKVRTDDVKNWKDVVMANKIPEEIGWSMIARLKHPVAASGMVVKNLSKMVHAIIVTQDYLAQAYKDFRKDDNVYVLPNTLDYEVWDALPLRKDNGDKVIIGWAGGAQHIHDIPIMTPALDIILKKYPNVEFHWAGISTKETDRLKSRYPNQCKELARVDIKDYAKAFADWNFDIFTAPLWENKFNFSKSNIKWLESSARRIPIITSPYEPYKDIKHGETGYLAKDTKEWVSAFEILINDKTKREIVGQNAYTESKRMYDPVFWANKRIEIYQHIINKYNANSDKCLRCGKCCYFEVDGKSLPCPYLQILDNGLTSCNIYDKRLGTIVFESGDKNICCGLRQDQHKNIAGCPYNT